MKSNVLGAAIAVSVGIASNLGVNVQKWSHDNEEARPKHLQRHYLQRPYWWLGMLLVVFGSLGDALALAFAPQTLVASLGGGSTIVANVLIAHFWLRQPLFFTDAIGVVLVSTGVVVLALSSKEEGTYSVAELFDLMFAPMFLVFVIATSIFVSILFLRVRRSTSPASQRVESVSVSSKTKEMEEISTRSKSYSVTLSPAECDGPESTKVSAVNSSNESPFANPAEQLQKNSLEGYANQKRTVLVIDKNLPLYWAAISGTFGAQSVLLAKCVMELLNTSIAGDNQFVFPGTWVLLAGMTVCLLSQTHALNKATMCGDTMSTFPVFQAFWIGIGNISGVVYFQQYQDFSMTQRVLFLFAFALVMVGIYLISKHEKMGKRTKYSVAIPAPIASNQGNTTASSLFTFQQLTPQEDEGSVLTTPASNASLKIGVEYNQNNVVYDCESVRTTTSSQSEVALS